MRERRAQTMWTQIKQRIPKKVHAGVEEAILWTKDLLDAGLGRREPMIPPRRLMFDGPRDVAVFKQNGAEFMRYYTDLCNLRPDEHVLDVGCGMGRKTIPLTTYLSQAGRYEGLDVNQKGVAWCQREITARFPNFRFQLIDVYSERYNPAGRQAAADYRFPFDDASFDFVILGSVFTHMLPAGVARYLAETARVLKPATARCLISYFILNEESISLMATAPSAFQFPVRRENHAVEWADRPEHAVAHDESYLRHLYATCGLKIEQIYYGAWCGRRAHLSFQDLVLARKV
jgi:SAM-dependent methyltransferase